MARRIIEGVLTAAILAVLVAALQIWRDVAVMKVEIEHIKTFITSDNPDEYKAAQRSLRDKPDKP